MEYFVGARLLLIHSYLHTDEQIVMKTEEVDVFFNVFVTHSLAPLRRVHDGDRHGFLFRDRLIDVIGHDDHAHEVDEPA